MGVHWKIPAAINRAPPSSGLVLTIIGDNNALECRTYWATAASPLNRVQTPR